MTRFFRILFLCTTALSLLLCVAWAVLWVRSYSWYEDAQLARGRQLVGMTSHRGRVLLIWDTDFPWDEDLSLHPAVYWNRRPADTSIQDLHVVNQGGAHWVDWQYSVGRPRSQLPAMATWRLLSFPHWLGVVLFVLMPAGWTIGFLRRRKRTKTPGACAVCGYDLRATPKRCPECGTDANVN